MSLVSDPIGSRFSDPISRPRRPAPHGRMRQDELKYFGAVGLSPRERSLLMTLRTRLSGATRDVRDSNAALAKWAGIVVEHRWLGELPHLEDFRRPAALPDHRLHRGHWCVQASSPSASLSGPLSRW